ncbi:restriction endonuclease subunit S [Parvibaculum sedimenti]|uniref:Restriction endonuclease subunit S n=1 Tax=Parvibaculum sedimenti TaxID=2608632 RepID=A0A6N6VE24_9HYPH|nr:restriction endonuclease subunit S [Parvibaculum sedimenti]KAB7738428.1 restriction endonuclease subunit S [Parvibaculum sedimenti]
MTTLADALGCAQNIIGGPFGSNLTQVDYRPAGIPVIRGSNMGVAGRFIGGNFVFVSAEKAKKTLSSNLAARGDIIVTQRGTMGQVSIIPTDSAYDCFVISQSQMAIRVPIEVADPFFVYYFLKSQKFLEYLDTSTIQTGVPHINLTILRQAPASWPPLEEQHAIASILGALDDKIELNRRMNETLEAMARAIFKDWFVDFGPTRAKMAMRGEDPQNENVARAPYLAPDVWSLFPDRLDADGKPQGWRNCAISELCDRVENGGTPARGEPQYWSPPSVPWLTSGEVRMPIIAETAQYISELGLQNSSAKIWPVGTTVVAMYGATAGQICLLGTSVSANQACCGLIPKRHMREYVFIALREDRSGLALKATGSAQQNLSQRLIADHTVIAPSFECVQAFSEAAESLFERWISNEFENRSLREVRDHLLPKLMSGEIRVKDAEKHVSEVV